MNKEVEIKDLGLIEYKKAWDYQEELLSKIVEVKIKNRNEGSNDSTKNYLIFVEHPHVYTLGKSGEIKNLLLNKEELEKKGIKFYYTNRGGDITYHGPGQVVCYPIIDLDNFFTDIHKYLRFLEEVVILTLNEFGINGERSINETGVWLDTNSFEARKICAMGVKASRWVTMHGLALNVNNDLSFFDNIIPCGISNKSITSIAKESNKKIDIDLVKNKIIDNFLTIFSAKLID